MMTLFLYLSGPEGKARDLYLRPIVDMKRLLSFRSSRISNE